MTFGDELIVGVSINNVTGNVLTDVVRVRRRAWLNRRTSQFGTTLERPKASSMDS
jgi:hypothetical protein